MKRFILQLVFLCTGAIIFFPIDSIAQSSVEASLRSPYHSMYTHLYFLQPDTYQPDKAALVISPESGLDSLKRRKAAIRLKQILDGQGLYVYFNQIPQEPNYKDSSKIQPYYTPFPKRMPEIYLEKLGDNWYYSGETVSLIPSLYKKVYPFGAELLVNLIPMGRETKVFGMATWQYLGILAILLLAAILHFLLQRILKPIINSLIKSRIDFAVSKPKLLLSLARILSLYFICWLIKGMIPSLLLPAKSAEFAQKGMSIFIAVLFAYLLYRLVEVLMLYLEKAAAKTEQKMDDQAIPLLERIFRIVVILGASFHILSLLDVNVTALIAGISIGGLALALAAQDTVKNLIGSLMIFIDRPFQIGDYVSGSGFEGTIVEVGFRTSRIQSVDTSIISIPNGNLANMSVTNLGVRTYRLMQTKIAITYDTPPKLIEIFMEGLKNIIINHPMLWKETYYVRFQSMDDFALTILFRTYIDTRAYPEELKIKEEIYLAIMRLAETLGVRFAFPSSTLYIEQFPEKRIEIPDYSYVPIEADSRMESFIKQYQKKISEHYGSEDASHEPRV